MYQLENFDREQFLSEYWQRQPLLIKNALPGFENPLPADELAGLALEPEVESRIVHRSGSTWALEHGPFASEALARNGPWTLLIQAVDHYVEAVASLWRMLDFLPTWRRDDVMVSYASAGGGVGPHYDNYDVFLLQGMGQRRWRLGQWCSPTDALLPHETLRILEDFDQSAEYLLEPGDILYLPPRLAHWGEAVTECMTYSLGFRAPAINELVSRALDHHLERMDPERFYTDPPLAANCRPGELSVAAVQRALELVRAQLAELGQDTHWLGELVTEPRCAIEPGDVEETVSNPDVYHVLPAARLAWSMNKEPMNKEPMNKEPMNKEPMNKEPMNMEPMNRETSDRATIAPEPANRHGAGKVAKDTSPVSVYANGIHLAASVACLPPLQTLIEQGSISRKYLNTVAGEKDMLELLAELVKVGCVYGE
jgi:50S ribosomal protein L16 3-hydroxylase